MRPELIEDLVHLKRGEDRLDQHRRADRPASDAELILRALEHAVPQPCLQMRLELGQIEVGAAAGRRQRLVVAQQVQAEIKQRARDRPAVHLEMALQQMPAARAHQQRRDPLVELIDLLAAVQANRARDRLAQVALPVDHVPPGRRVGVLEIRHEHPRPGVERVDHHLAIRRTRDLHPPIRQIGRRRRHPPIPGAHTSRRRQKVRQLTSPQRSRARTPRGQQLLPFTSELARKQMKKLDRLRGQHIAARRHVGVARSHRIRSLYPALGAFHHTGRLRVTRAPTACTLVEPPLRASRVGRPCAST